MELTIGKRYRVTDRAGHSLIYKATSQTRLEPVPGYLAGLMGMEMRSIDATWILDSCSIEPLEDQIHE